MDSLSVHFLDRFTPDTLFFVSVGLMVLFIEIGFRLSARPGHSAGKSQHSQVRAIMGAGLGLTAFMLAFTFAMAQSHYEVRVQGLVDETLLLNTTFMQADLMPEPERSEARELLRELVSDRLAMSRAVADGDLGAAFEMIERADEIHHSLWRLGHGLAGEEGADDGTARRHDAFLTSVIGLMNIQTSRLESSIVNRIPSVIWFTLYLTGALSMLIVGYQGGIIDRRSPYATVTLAVTFSVVLMLITDLDRPVMRFFTIDQQIVVDLAARMDEALAAEAR